MTDDLLVAASGGVLTLTLNRPQARNAVTVAIANAMVEAIDAFDRDDELRVAVVTGAGGSFCAGMDLKRFAAGEVPRIPGRGFAGLTARPPRKPLIAAVEGYALAGGFEIVLAADLVVASEQARFALSEVKHGLTAGSGLVRLPRRLPRNVAMEFALTGDMLGAQRLYELGLVNRLAKPGQALEEALVLARAIAGHRGAAVLACKRVVDESVHWPAEELFERQARITDPVSLSTEGREGALAFANRKH